MIEINEKKNEAVVSLSPLYYGEEAVRQAAQVFSEEAETFLARDAGEAGRLVVTVVARKPADRDALRRLAGEFLNELLSIERRGEVFRQNRKIIEWTMTQALLACRQTSEQEAEAARITEALNGEAERLIEICRREKGGA